MLRPAEGGQVLGGDELLGFMEHLLQHSATRLTQHERSRFWEDAVYGPNAIAQNVYAGLPPESATVLLGFVKNEKHWRWIEKTNSYNVRVKGREGGVEGDSAIFNAQLILLYCPSINEIRLARSAAGPEQLSALELKATGYPQPQGLAYWCVQLLWVNRPDWVEGLSCDRVAGVAALEGAPLGRPILMTWAGLLNGAS